MGIFRRKRRESGYVLPPVPEPVDAGAVDEARATLHAAESRDEEIETGAGRLAKIQHENSLGPRFWAAVGEQRRA